MDIEHVNVPKKKFVCFIFGTNVFFPVSQFTCKVKKEKIRQPTIRTKYHSSPNVHLSCLKTRFLI